MEHGRVARIVIGLGLALGLAVLAAHPRVKALEKRLGITMLISAGLPFLAMGAVFRRDAVGFLTDEAFADLQPAFEFGLGWIGFVIGMHFDMGRVVRLPPDLGPVIAIESCVPVFTTAVFCS